MSICQFQEVYVPRNNPSECVACNKKVAGQRGDRAITHKHEDLSRYAFDEQLGAPILEHIEGEALEHPPLFHQSCYKGYVDENDHCRHCGGFNLLAGRVHQGEEKGAILSPKSEKTDSNKWNPWLLAGIALLAALILTVVVVALII